MKDECTVETERIDDLPVLIEWLKQMKVDAIIDDHTHAHGLWGGSSKGVLGMTWIAHMIMTGDHRKVRLNEMLGAGGTVWEYCWAARCGRANLTMTGWG